METKFLATYLHDHHAGAGAALEMLDKLVEVFKHKDVGGFLIKLRDEITFEKGHLQYLTAIYPIASSPIRKAAAAGAKLGFDLKMAIDAAHEDSFRLFESLEALSIGIAGKRLLWRILAQSAKFDEKLRGLDYIKLINMAVRQRKELEPFRMRASKGIV